MSGIYQIYNYGSNKRYIGSSINIDRRFNHHKRALEKNEHKNAYLQNSWNKNNKLFEFSILELCEPDECFEFEQYYLDYYKPFGNNGYNIQKIASGKYVNGRKNKSQSEKLKEKYKNGEMPYRIWSDWSSELKNESIKKIKAKSKERFSDYKNKKGNKFLKIEFDNGLTLYFYGYNELERLLKIGHSTIAYAVENKNGRMNKYKANVALISEEEYTKVAGQK